MYVHSRKHKTEDIKEDTAYHSGTCKQTNWLLISCKYANINVLINYKCTHGIYIYTYSTHMSVCMRNDFPEVMQGVPAVTKSQPQLRSQYMKLTSQSIAQHYK